MKTITLRVSDELHDSIIKRLAQVRDVTITGIVWQEEAEHQSNEAVWKYLESRNKPYDPLEHANSVRKERDLERNMDRRLRPAKPAQGAMDETECMPATLTLPKSVIRKGELERPK